MSDENGHEDDGAALRAFAELRAEVIVMRKTVESLPAAIEEFAAPDYTPSARTCDFRLPAAPFLAKRDAASD